MTRSDYWKAERDHYWAERTRTEFLCRADEPPPPTLAEVDAIEGELAPDLEEFEARERAKEREAA